MKDFIPLTPIFAAIAVIAALPESSWPNWGRTYQLRHEEKLHQIGLATDFVVVAASGDVFINIERVRVRVRQCGTGSRVRYDDCPLAQLIAAAQDRSWEQLP